MVYNTKYDLLQKLWSERESAPKLDACPRTGEQILQAGLADVFEIDIPSRLIAQAPLCSLVLVVWQRRGMLFFRNGRSTRLLGHWCLVPNASEQNEAGSRCVR